MQECTFQSVGTTAVVVDTKFLLKRSINDCEFHSSSTTMPPSVHGRAVNLSTFTTTNEYDHTVSKVNSQEVPATFLLTKEGTTLSDFVKPCKNHHDSERYTRARKLPERHTKASVNFDELSIPFESTTVNPCKGHFDHHRVLCPDVLTSNLEATHFLNVPSTTKTLSSPHLVGDSHNCHQSCTDSGGGSSGQGSSSSGSNKKQKNSSTSSSQRGSTSSSGQHGGTGMGSGRSRSGSSDSSDDNGDDEKRPPHPRGGRKEPKDKSDFQDDDDEATDSADEGGCDDTPRSMRMDFSPQSQNDSRPTTTNKDPTSELMIYDSNKNSSGGASMDVTSGNGSRGQSSIISIEPVGINLIKTSLPTLNSPVNMAVGYGIPAASSENIVMDNKSLPESNPESRTGTPTQDSPHPLEGDTTTPRTPMLSPKITSVTQVNDLIIISICV